MSLLPAFVDLWNVSSTVTITIMFIATIAVVGVKGSYAILADKAIRLFGQVRTRKRLETTAGCILIERGPSRFQVIWLIIKAAGPGCSVLK